MLAGCWYCNVPTKMSTLPEGRVKTEHIYKVEGFTLHQITDDYFKQGATQAGLCVMTMTFSILNALMYYPVLMVSLVTDSSRTTSGHSFQAFPQFTKHVQSNITLDTFPFNWYLKSRILLNFNIASVSSGSSSSFDIWHEKGIDLRLTRFFCVSHYQNINIFSSHNKRLSYKIEEKKENKIIIRCSTSF